MPNDSMRNPYEHHRLRIDFVIKWAKRHPGFDRSVVDKLSDNLELRGYLYDQEARLLESLIEKYGMDE